MKTRFFLMTMIVLFAVTVGAYSQVKYTATIANDSATVSEVDVYKVTIPANDWADGEGILCSFVTISKQNSGSTVNLTTKIKYGSNVLTVNTASPQYNSPTVGNAIRSIYLKRVGTDIYISCAPNPAQLGLNNPGISYDALTAPAGGKLTGVSFASNTDIVITLQWSVANANTYFNVIQGDAVKQ